MKAVAVLVVDDEALQRETLSAILEDQSYHVTQAKDCQSALAALAIQAFDIVITDLRIPGGSGMDVARRAIELSPECATFIMTAYADVQGVIEAMRAGIMDYLVKPLHVESLLRRLSAIRERGALMQEVSWLRVELNRTATHTSLIGESSALAEVKRLIARVAETRGTVLITGESGTGKEVVAREIHRLGAKQGHTSGKFVAINCGAVPENLLESELFGHKRGAFTGAIADKQGLFLVADGGTILFDEIGEMPKNLQVKLLRVLQEREFVPVGDTRPVKVNLRVIAATNRDLSAAVAAGHFRQDLYYRINVVEIRNPPLRDRIDDVPALARHFVEKYARELGKAPLALTGAVLRSLMRYSWPGNIRELENVIERALILSRDPERIDIQALPAMFQPACPLADQVDSLDEAIRRFSKRHILSVLDAKGGDKKEAARSLGVSLSHLYRKLDELGIPTKRSAEDSRLV